MCDAYRAAPLLGTYVCLLHLHVPPQVEGGCSLEVVLLNPRKGKQAAAVAVAGRKVLPVRQMRCLQRGVILWPLFILLVACKVLLTPLAPVFTTKCIDC